jgi:TPP-dependent pyruvate/acetoin dehydrogenase alpha subunit
VFVIENNGYGMGTAIARAAAIADLWRRADSYGMPGAEVDGQDVVAVRQITEEALARARAGDGPTLIEARTFRYVGHSMSDAASGTYRSKEELEASRERDPIVLFEEKMRGLGLLSDADVKAIEDEAAAAVADAVQFAESSPDPDPSELTTDVYAPEGGR